MSSGGTERVLLIGATGLDWRALEDAAARGLAPNLAALMSRGISGSFGLPAVDGIAPWATMVTGVPSLAHGIWRDREAWAGGLRPTGRASWAVAPAWARLEAAGVPTASVAWPAARPGDAWTGMHVDDGYATASANSWEDWALPLHCARADVREALRDRRVHPADLGAAQLMPLVPDLGDIDQEREPGLALLAVAMAQAASVQAAAAWLLDQCPARAVFVHHRWLGDVRGRVAAGAAPPWDVVIDGAWRFLDGLVGRLVALAGADARVIVASPGWRGAHGVAIIAGPAIAAGRRAAMQLADIAPTLLAALDFTDPALPGRVIAGEAGKHPLPDVQMPAPVPQDGGPSLAAVVAQGYTPPPGPPLRWQVEALTGRARLLLRDDPAAASEAAAAALQLLPDDIDALSQRAAAHVALGEADALPPLAEALLRLAAGRPWGSLVQGAHHALKGEAGKARPWLLATEASRESDSVLRAGAAWLVLGLPADATRAFEAVLAAQPDTAEAAIGLSTAALQRGDHYRAEQVLQRLLAADPGQAAAWAQLATVLERVGRDAEAAAAARAAARLGIAVR